MIADFIYGLGSAAKNALFDCGVFRSYRSRLVVLSVGNLSTGGNGKTPLCIYLAQRIQALGKRPVILLRGYAGRIRGPHLVTPSDTAEMVGDEAVMLSQSISGRVVISTRRVAGAELIEKMDLGDVIILDDGFQHRWLARDLDLLAVDASCEESISAFLAGKLLPVGRFREDRARGLKRANAVVFNSRSDKVLSESDLSRLCSGLPGDLKVFSTHLEHPTIKVSDAAVAVCGLANPRGFFESVRSLGFKEVVERPFSDHHVFTRSELDRLLTEHVGFQFVCTQKDFVRLPEPYRRHFTSLAAQLVFNDPGGFDDLISVSIS